MAETRISRAGTGGRSATDDESSASTSRHAVAVCVLLLLLALARVASTYPVFSQTTDESVHIVSGYDWWNGSWDRIDPQHPPLARILFGLPFVLQQGEPDAEDTEWPGRGNTLLWSNGQYLRDLGLARAGNLLFLAALLWIVFAWTRWLADDATALLAVALTSALPPVLAHAGLATTDLAAATTTVAAAYALSRWLERPTLKRSILLGLAVGLGVAAKFSFLLFFPTAAIVILLLARLPGLKVTSSSAAVVVLVAFLLVLSVYRFSLAELFRGWTVFWTHATGGHPEGAFLLGEVSITRAAPHPDPLPGGERGLVVASAASSPPRNPRYPRNRGTVSPNPLHPFSRSPRI